ncbi:MAG: DUF222 domain-containing protein [Microbacterium sp.]
MGHDLTTDDGWTAALDDVVMSVTQTRRQIAALEAAQTRALSTAVELVSARVAQQREAGRRMSRSDLALREVAAELGAAMRVTDRTIQGRMGDAATLTARFPLTLTAWDAGSIDAAHVNAILDAGVVISDDTLRARYEVAVIAVAEMESAGRLRGIAATIAAQIDPDSTAEQLTRAIDERRVRKFDLGNGNGRLVMDHSLVLIDAAFDRITEMSRTVVDGDEPRAPGEGSVIAEAGADATVVTGPSAQREPARGREPRTLDQIRADVCADLLLAGAPAAHGDGDSLAAIAGHVQITVPALTAAGVGDEPCLLAGHGPIDTRTALRIAGAAPGWDRVLTDPHTGAVLAVDRYRPDKQLRRHLAARDERCRFPGCRRPALRADIDHTLDAAKGGATVEGNLGHFCRRHHTLKHHTAWRVRQRPGGVIEWTSPTGRIHVDRPPATVRFVPTDWLERLLAEAPSRDLAPF